MILPLVQIKKYGGKKAFQSVHIFISCQAKCLWEVTKEQTAYLYHRILTSAGYSASSVEKYHYHSDCHRHIRGNLILITGVLAILKYRNHGVPAKVAIIRNKVLVNDLFNFQAKRLPFLLSGMNPFTHLDKGV